jgi:hypothetical protein
VLIGTPTAGAKAGRQGAGIESILQQLRSRQIAEEQVETYSRQQTASIKERELREAEARAKQQTALTESDISIAVQSNQGKADLARAEQQAAQIQALARAEAEKVRMLGEGEARKIAALAQRGAERAARVGHRAGDGDRGAGARLRRAALPADAAGDVALRRGDRRRRASTWCRRW